MPSVRERGRRHEPGRRRMPLHEIETTYSGTEKLLDKVDLDTLDWKLQTGINWMTVGH